MQRHELEVWAANAGHKVVRVFEDHAAISPWGWHYQLKLLAQLPDNYQYERKVLSDVWTAVAVVLGLLGFKKQPSEEELEKVITPAQGENKVVPGV